MRVFKRICSILCVFFLLMTMLVCHFVAQAETAVTPVKKMVNVAKGKKVIVNGTSHGEGNKLTNDVINSNDYWICFAGAAQANTETGAQVNKAEAIIDLGRKYKPEKIVVFDRQGTIATSRNYFTILGSNDLSFANAAPLFEMGEDEGSFPQNKNITINLKDAGYYRYIKFQKTSTWQATQLSEIQVFAEVTATEISRGADAYGTPVQSQIKGTEYTGVYGPESTVDGKLDTRWWGAYYNSTVYLNGTGIKANSAVTIDLKTAKNVGLIELYAGSDLTNDVGWFYLYGSNKAVTDNEMSDIVDENAETQKRYFDLTHAEWIALSDYNYNTLFELNANATEYELANNEGVYNPFPVKKDGSFLLTVDDSEAYRYYTYRRSRSDLYGSIAEFTLYEINPTVYKVDSTNVVSGELTLYFTDEMKKETLNNGTIKLYDESLNEISYTSYEAFDDYYVLKGDFSGESYYVEVTNGAKNKLGVSAAQEKYAFDGLESDEDIYNGLPYKTELYNVASNKPATTHVAGQNAGPAFDNDRGTQALNRFTLFPSDNSYIQVDLLRKYVIEEIEVNGSHSGGLAESDSTKSGRRNFIIQASNDRNFAEENTVNLYTQGETEFEANKPLTVQVDTNGEAYRYVRYKKTKNESSIITEIKIFAQQTMTEVSKGMPTVASHAISLTYPANRGHYSAERLVDGNNAENTETWLAYAPYVPFWRIDLKRPYPIGAVELESAYGADNRAGRLYWDIYGSNTLIENEFDTLTSTDVAASKNAVLNGGYTELCSVDQPYPNVEINGIKDFMSPMPPLSSGYGKWSVDDTNAYKYVTLKKNVNVTSASLGEIRLFVINPVVNSVSMADGIITIDFSDELKAKTVKPENITVKKNGLVIEINPVATKDGYGINIEDASASSGDVYEITVSRMIRNKKNVTMTEDFSVKIRYNGETGEITENYCADGNLAYMHPVKTNGLLQMSNRKNVVDGDFDSFAKAEEYKIDLLNRYDLSKVLVTLASGSEAQSISVYVTDTENTESAEPVYTTSALSEGSEISIDFDETQKGRYITVRGAEGVLSVSEIHAYSKENVFLPTLETVSVNKDITRVGIVTDGTAPKNADLLLAVYKDGKLSSLSKKENITLARNGKAQYVTIDSYIPYDGGEFKAFLWDGELTPLADNSYSAEELFSEALFNKVPECDLICEDSEDVYKAYKALDPASKNDANFKGINAIFYEGPLYQSEPTKVFAYLGIPENASSENKVPAVVLVHGGGGTANMQWVKMWMEKGYAAISMDLNGTVPSAYTGWAATNSILGAYAENSLKHEWAGRKAGTQDVDLCYPEGDSWPGQATQMVVLANNLLRNIDKIDSSKIGISGISWGGYLTSLMTGIDNRFAFANPIYGCGYLDLSNTYFYSDKIDDGAGDYHWDAKYFIKKAKMPIIWVNSDHDGNFDITAFSRSFEDSPEGSVMTILPDLGHGMSIGASVNEVYAFAESVVRNREGLIKVCDVTLENNVAEVTYELPENVKLESALLYYNTDEELPYNGKYTSGEGVKWTALSPDVVQNGKLKFNVPDSAVRFYINLTDDNGYVSSSKLVIVK